MNDASRVRLGVVQPIAYWGEDAPRNLEQALHYIHQAGALGVDLLLFPETYPGPYTDSVRYPVEDSLRAAAKDHRVGLVAGTTTETETGSGSYFVEAVVIDKDGSEVGRYRRTHPVGPYVFPGGAFWDLDYKEGNEIPVFEMEWGKLGVGICSETFVPEVARTLALRGAEVAVFPTGILIDEQNYTDNWRTMIRARSIENLMYTATTVHLLPREFLGDAADAIDSFATGSGHTGGDAMIAAPERVLAATHEPGILTADLDLDYLRRMRATDEVISLPAPYRTIPGVLRWRRPELYASDELEPSA
ncbi:MAG: carbon-nitrogen hydrolase family protein [Solirubrobacterales bacterium]